MKRREYPGPDVERMLDEARQRQQTPAPPDSWPEKVMQAIRTERDAPQVIRFRVEARTAWRTALATAAAAVIVAAAGIWMLPSDGQLAWEIEQNDALSAWAWQAGE
ncbi:MAG TPA: hypothetical protein PLT20_07995 [Sedimentisphaerales bacterium]|nr:hypothetical protein [Phycisphaerae bacterium]HON90351.1 hypothetical protein [Sedimentisphaerales bacterium]HQI28013.1 hypothetical protein [Sedimentisphaerales bacterium]